MAINGVTYQQYWYLGPCWQPTTGETCGATTASTVMIRVVIAVTWPDSSCTDGLGTYLTSTLVSSAVSDPVFPPSDTVS